MLCTPEALLQKNQALSNTWQRYRGLPSFEHFVELAVSINSFTEFLIDKGITALHHASHQLEQVTLTQFNKDVAHPLPQAALDDLNERVLALQRMTHTHATASADLAEQLPDAQQHAQDIRAGQTWLIGHEPSAWQALQAQLGSFGMAASFISWEQPLPDDMGIAPLLLLDLSEVRLNEVKMKMNRILLA